MKVIFEQIDSALTTEMQMINVIVGNLKLQLQCHVQHLLSDDVDRLFLKIS